MTLTYYRFGLGDTAQQVSAVTQGALSTLGATPGAITGIAEALGVAVPVVGWAIAGLTLAVPFIVNAFRGCGATCTAATRIADQAEMYLKANLEAYQTGPHTVSSQQVALATAQQLLQAVQQGCSNPALMEAGQRCISERLIKGGTAPWCPTPDHRGCDWITLYVDPIANDPHVVPDNSIDPQTLGGSEGGDLITGVDNSKLMFAGFIIVGMIWMMNSD